MSVLMLLRVHRLLRAFARAARVRDHKHARYTMMLLV